ncbi:hypothetical protein F5890DRAFT_1479198 [Lentinula detonsa]|uniref:Uncharacterized protein n=1 Tax=Lentinula detonsa TaxID=2804962 RepID=A0AA38PNB5_9AGAR|nr:hypothetical protein F5890DRAFT_1479198 [Lentinula detonsa]
MSASKFIKLNTSTETPTLGLAKEAHHCQFQHAMRAGSKESTKERSSFLISFIRIIKVFQQLYPLTGFFSHPSVLSTLKVLGPCFRGGDEMADVAHEWSEGFEIQLKQLKLQPKLHGND